MAEATHEPVGDGVLLTLALGPDDGLLVQAFCEITDPDGSQWVRAGAPSLGAGVKSPMFTLRYPADFFGLSGAKDGRERMRGTYDVRWYESDDVASGKISRRLAKDSFRL